jgi:hypothetical protein
MSWASDGSSGSNESTATKRASLRAMGRSIPDKTGGAPQSVETNVTAHYTPDLRNFR